MEEQSGLEKGGSSKSLLDPPPEQALDETILKNVTLGGLTALEFFQVYFANDAPFGFSEFQAQRGDVNIQYGSWQESEEPLFSKSCQPPQQSSSNSKIKRLERTLSFKTLTKSYFGPTTYATANKEQHATLYCDNTTDNNTDNENVSMVVVDSKTTLLDIPFGDRFHVLERWVYNTFSRSKNTLNVSVAIVMVQSCPWEAQIRKKSSQTLNQVLSSWYHLATQALIQVRQNQHHSDTNTKQESELLSTPTTTTPQHPEEEPFELLRRHEEIVIHLEQQLDQNNVLLSSIEVRHDDDDDNNALSLLSLPVEKKRKSIRRMPSKLLKTLWA
jgi:hypothetical protein